MANILVYGGAFDPVHKGHMASAFLARGRLMEVYGDHYEIWLSPSYHDTFGEKKGLADNVHHRLEMLKLTLKYDYAHVPDMFICTAEMDAKNKMGTYELMKELQRQYPKYNFRFLMGMDAALKMYKWRNSRKLKREFGMVVVPRMIERVSTYSGNSLGNTTLNYHFEWMQQSSFNDGPQHLKIAQAPASIPMASSKLRHLLATKQYKEAKKILPKTVYDYIRQNGLYEGEEHVIKPKAKARPPLPKRSLGRRSLSKG